MTKKFYLICASCAFSLLAHVGRLVVNRVRNLEIEGICIRGDSGQQKLQWNKSLSVLRLFLAGKRPRAPW
eukprot:5904289-Amphidinium_carterae.1